MVEYTHVIITLVAGIVYTIVSIIVGLDTITWCYNLIFLILIFNVIGYFFKRYLKKNIFNDKIEDGGVTSSNSLDDGIENDLIEINNKEIKENENFFESLGDE